MSTLSEQARAAMKSKAEKLVRSDPTKPVDASGYRPDGALNGDVMTGMRPISRRQYRRGGTVAGESATPRADRKPRATGGGLFHEMKRKARATGGALTADSLINRDVREANKERDGIKHTGGFKRGGEVHKDAAQDRKLIHEMGCKCEKCSGGRVGRASGGGIPDGTRPVGGRMARKGGGRTKGKTNINIVIAPQGGAGAMPPRPMPAPGPAAPPGAPVGMHQGAPPPAAAAPPPQMQPMMRKDGGRAGFEGKLVKPGAYPIETGAGGGLGRLEKAQRAKRVNP